MDDDLASIQNQSNQTAPSPDQKTDWNKILIGISVFGLILLVSGISFAIGRSNQKEVVPTPTPTPLPTQPIIPSPKPRPEDDQPKAETPTPTPKILSKTLSGDKNLDGFQSSNGGGNLTLDIRAGRNVNLVTRGFVSFDISSLPKTSTITEVTLRLYQAKTVGNPYGSGGNLIVDHLKFEDNLENADYGAPALLSSFATLSTNAAVEWKEVDVKSEVMDDLSNSRSLSQYRIHFNTENTGGDVIGDFVYIESADNSEATGNTPQLVIKYY
ncbi:hypothetical protein A2V80_00090 [Candidatus Woesebacteria bacterium RBG_16_39_8b]|uniref:Carbohydrate-binding module family 96 domain-containing protein n=1 Tax=Candidatus Woesebacteria bacterium RBG_16_39_8b TaxID=1802482 RepID=A0A1F7XC63_9BACT|nr:MAG: hypothetical protein A2V80_00090 [Candidatus Woesebacteria bacterium RBG_16_39_8b]